ncbi:hypothetical protein BH09BAC4_BH09BAC4_42230 [soil metagenome]
MHKSLHWVILLGVQFTLASCSDKAGNSSESSTASSDNFQEGSDYLLFERVRMIDKVGFTQPAEAYSLLLPKGWTHEGAVIWNNPGSSCEGTFSSMKARSADGKYSLQTYPDLIYIWNSNPQLMQFYQTNGFSSPNCALKEPMDAERYLKDVFGPQELGNPEIVKVEENPLVVEQMQQSNEKSMSELRQYGAGDMQFRQTAINAQVRWPDGSHGFVVLGTNVLETVVPNTYNGTSDKMYTTQVTKRTVFKYPESDKEQAEHQFSVMLSSIRTNPSWNDAVNKFWKDARQRKQVAHIGRIKLMDEQTRAMGEAAIRKGNDRLQAMDSEMRSWEERQSSQDRMHTNFIKTIREVENYQDATGKIELTSGYNHAWSRGDGSSFIMSNNPNFDPSTVFQDQQWKEMKKVD